LADLPCVKTALKPFRFGAVFAFIAPPNYSVEKARTSRVSLGGAIKQEQKPCRLEDTSRPFSN